MRRFGVAFLFGALATAVLFFVIDQADRAVPPPQPTPVVPPTIMLAPGSSDVHEFERPSVAENGGGSMERPPAATPRPSVSMRHHPTATSLARALAFSSSPSTVAAEALLLSAIPSDIPDVLAASPDSATRVTPRAGEALGGPETPRASPRANSNDAPASLPIPRVGVSRAAVPRRTPEPRYPERIRARGGEGTVSTRITIDAAGQVSNVEVLGASGDPGLRSHVVEILRTWTFEAALDKGVAIPSTTVRKFVFRLDDPK